MPSSLCDPMTQPAPTQLCNTGITCPIYRNSFYDAVGEGQEHLPGLDHTQPLVQPYPPPSSGHIPHRAAAERLVGSEQVVPSESTFIPEEWGPCSATCGEGIRRREVQCKIFLEFSRTIARLPDNQCQGPKPSETERLITKIFKTPQSKNEAMNKVKVILYVTVYNDY
ncbi:hypothetical protein C0J52_21399 [Blattella germanica]|nr:hypothetical protein C0J52_21399 [Blattella germanica]